jgi:hypothetical protein
VQSSVKGSNKKYANEVWLGFFAEPFCKSMGINKFQLFNILKEACKSTYNINETQRSTPDYGT